MSDHPGVTARPPSFAQMLVDSTDRYPKGYPTSKTGVTSSSNWKLNNQNAALYGYFTRLAVTQCQLQYNLPTIVAFNPATGSGNNIFYITQTANDPSGNPVNPIQITISTSLGGWYDFTSLAAAITTALNAGAGVVGTFVCSYSAQSGGFNIANGTNDFFILSPEDCAKIPGATQNAVVSIARCLATLGLTSAVSDTLAIAASGTAPSMLYTPYIDIISRYLTKYQRVKDFTTLKNPTKSSILMRVYMTPPNTVNRPQIIYDPGLPGFIQSSPFSQPFTICVDPNQPKFITWSPDEAVANFDLQLLDTFGIELPFTTNVGGYGGQCEYQLTIFASES